MSTTESDMEKTAKKSVKLPLIIGMVLALLGGAGGFFAVYSGYLLGGTQSAASTESDTDSYDALPDVGYVGLDPFIVSLTSDGPANLLRFAAQLEVPSQHVEEVERVKPRIIDVLNGYLRALSAEDIESPDALVQLRAQMLRRVQIVTGSERVRDLLVMEFVLS
ncbi:flagellar basal body-associated FliL family protein [Shimia haliotis]|uniref:Flagellar protein FliL n=1 Tax=Shimia haliotis TaxID=1280847 RepID=A0A1I4DBQ8_9RHOB|nr:flagellar basal body-associated FliL family protein [Shimia haliotis]SFK91234.1 flagellar FliL protein [Shimia haliotis]